jgi:hypothetical protein
MTVGLVGSGPGAEAVEAALDDADARYKIRSARQLVAVVSQTQQRTDEAVRETLDSQTLDELQKMGYFN